jgi:predicted GIY-YIG superfamily endonuclease
MDAGFSELINSLEPKYRALVSMAPVKYAALPRKLPTRGIYLFSEGSDHLYVGRTNRLRERLRGHCIPSGTHYTATFAFRIARKSTGRTEATYSSAGSRADLVNDAVFSSAFEAAKQRIAVMDIRFVEEPEPTRQALLEIYAATVLKTPYNDFDNH